MMYFTIWKLLSQQKLAFRHKVSLGFGASRFFGGTWHSRCVRVEKPFGCQSI
jgi:hypothetical protein